MRETKQYDRRRLNPLLSFLQKKHNEFYNSMTEQLKETYKRQIMKKAKSIEMYYPKNKKKRRFYHYYSHINSYYIKQYFEKKYSKTDRLNYNSPIYNSIDEHKRDLESAVIYQLIQDKLITPYVITNRENGVYFRFDIYIDKNLTPKERFDKMFNDTCERYNPGLEDYHKNKLYKILELSLLSKRCFSNEKIKHNINGELLLVPNICQIDFIDNNQPSISVMLTQGFFKKSTGTLQEIEFKDKIRINNDGYLDVNNCFYKTFKNKFLSSFAPKLEYKYQIFPKGGLGISFLYGFKLLIDQKKLEKYLGIKLQKRFFDKYLSMINWHQEKKRKYMILNCFKQLIDQNLFKTMCSTYYNSSYDFYNYLNANGNNKRKIIRLQAIKSYPLLANALFKNKIIKDAIDKQKKLEDILSQISGFKKSLIRHIAKQYVQRTGKHIKKLFLLFLENKMDLNHDIRILEIQQYLLNEFLILHDFSKKDYIEITKKIKMFIKFADWKQINPEHVKLFMNYKRDINNIKPFFEFHNELMSYLGIFYDNIKYNKNRNIIMFYLIFGFNPSFRKMEDRLKRWENQNANIHDNIYEISNKYKEDALKNIEINSNNYWLPLCDDYVNEEQKESVICLNNYHALIQEGKEMHHCVGGYSYLCMTDETHILSIKTKQGMSTAEIITKNNNCHIIQHYTKYNKEPHKNNELLLNSFLQKNAKNIQYDIIKKRCLKTLNENKSLSYKDILLDKNNIEQKKQVWKLFQPYLSKDFENIDFDMSIKRINLYLKDFQ